MVVPLDRLGHDQIPNLLKFPWLNLHRYRLEMKTPSQTAPAKSSKRKVNLRLFELSSRIHIKTLGYLSIQVKLLKVTAIAKTVIFRV